MFSPTALAGNERLIYRKFPLIRVSICSLAARVEQTTDEVPRNAAFSAINIYTSLSCSWRSISCLGPQFRRVAVHGRHDAGSACHE